MSKTIEPFQPTGKFEWPAPPTEDSIKRFVAPILQRLRRRNHAPHIAQSRLRRTAEQTRDMSTLPPVCEMLLRELGATLDDWAAVGPQAVSGTGSNAQGAHADSLRLIILPPCQELGLLAQWARRNGHRIIEPPAGNLTALDLDADPARLDTPYAAPALPGSRAIAGQLVPDLRSGKDGQLLVIPQLERWFLRHSNGLALVRALLATLDNLDRRCVVGCNSWAWAFLQKAAGADLILPHGLTFKAFDAQRLYQWFGMLSPTQLESGERADAQSGQEPDEASNACVTFRLARNGKKVLQMPPSNDALSGDAQTEYFRILAGRSLGIPWVAWRIWREALRARIEDADKSDNGLDGAGEVPGKSEPIDTADDGRTVWIAESETFSLPDGREADALLVLHALLIHDALLDDELRAVLPAPTVFAIVPALLSAGYLERRDNRLQCRALAYPSIRSALATGGYPMDRL